MTKKMPGNNFNTIHHPHKGFTLAETMVALGISGFILIAVYGTLDTGRRAWLIGDALADSQQQAKIAMLRITKELRSSNPLEAAISGDRSTITFRVPVDTDGDGNIDYQFKQVIFGAEDSDDFDQDGQLRERDWRIEYLRGGPHNTSLIRRVINTDENVVNARVIANHINVLTFQTGTGGTGVPTDGAVDILLTTQIDTIQGRAISPPLQTTLRTRVNFRN